MWDYKTPHEIEHAMFNSRCHPKDSTCELSTQVNLSLIKAGGAFIQWMGSVFCFVASRLFLKFNGFSEIFHLSEQFIRFWCLCLYIITWKSFFLQFSVRTAKTEVMWVAFNGQKTLNECVCLIPALRPQLFTKNIIGTLFFLFFFFCPWGG